MHAAMWRYLPGVRQPQTATVSSKQTRYDDEADSRQFVRSWLEDFSWLFYDSSTKIMYCKLCQKHHKKNVFATCGSTNFRRLAFVDDTISLEHTDAIKADQDSLNAAPIFTSATDLADKAMITLLEAAYFLAQEDLAILKF